MFGSISTKNLFLLLAGLIALNPVFATDFDYNQYKYKQTTQDDFSDYMVSVNAKISKAWNPPNVLEVGHAAVIFKVDRHGNVISSYIKESSGNKLYDESALHSIQLASPYAAFPANTTKDVITIQYSFDSSVVQKEHIKELVDLSDSYINRDNLTALKYLDQAIKEIEGDPAAYFLYGRRHKLDKIMGDEKTAAIDLAECKRLKAIYNTQRINKCKEALLEEETPFGYFALATAYELAGDYQNAIYNIDKAISMTELNQAYKRYRAEIIMKKSKFDN